MASWRYGWLRYGQRCSEQFIFTASLSEVCGLRPTVNLAESAETESTEFVLASLGIADWHPCLQVLALLMVLCGLVGVPAPCLCLTLLVADQVYCVRIVVGGPASTSRHQQQEAFAIVCRWACVDVAALANRIFSSPVVSSL